jgi:Zn-dependent alcohol dehydrogenase
LGVYAQGWGLTVVLGIHMTPQMTPLHPMELFDGRRITGCVFGDFKGKSQLPDLVDKCINGVHTIPACHLLPWNHVLQFVPSTHYLIFYHCCFAGG